MAEHPEYQSTIEQISRSGFEIKKSSGDPHVAILEVMSPTGQLLRVERVVYVRDGMRFLDLEHEAGHVQQFNTRFGDRPPPTKRVVERPDGSTANAPDQSGILTVAQNAVAEYHNRLVEFLRLYERGSSAELLREHAEGVLYWRLKHQKGIGRSPSGRKWANEHFSDISALWEKYLGAGGLGLESSARVPGSG